MGYNSKVCITLPEDVTPGFLKLFEPDGKAEYQAPDKVSIKDAYGGGQAYVFEWNWTKWYEDFDEIIAINDYLDSIGEEKYDYKRIGEDYGDVEEKGAYYSGIYISMDFDTDGAIAISLEEAKAKSEPNEHQTSTIERE